MNQVLALIPAYNEALGVAAVVIETLAYLPVLVVDDGSTDATAQRAEAAGATVLRQRPNQGKGVALRAGFRWALEQGYEGVVTLDADGQHDPDEIPKFLQSFTDYQADLVIGTRNFRQIPGLRRYTNFIGRWLFSWVLGHSVPDNQSGYRLLSRRLMEATLDSREPGFHFEIEMIVTCVQRGFNLELVPIRTIYAGETSHIKPIPFVIDFFRMLWQTRRQVQKGKQERLNE